jgi:ATP-dependent helicase Lhr and Lhr-like helicase
MSAAQSLSAFHPLVQRWFLEEVGQPSPPQMQGWPHIAAGKDLLLAAPTGTGKTLTAFLSCLDQLLRLSLEHGLENQTRVLYVSPLKALGNDVQKNLLQPLERLVERARAEGLDPQPIRVLVRTGDTPAGERAAMVKTPPHILITTPESLFLYLTAGRARETLRHVRTVVVDEIHALARDKRGSHLALSLERLDALCGASRPQRVGLSATQKPLDAIARFLGGAERTCEIVNIGHVRDSELTLEVPEDELSAVATHEMWGQVYDRLVELSQENRTMLVFTNTRKLAERVAHDLGQRIGEDKVAAHHGSMSRELRLKAEERLKRGELKVMCATASLELGLDIGSIDRVVQLGSPRAIAVMLQRLGRAGHRLSAVSKATLFAFTRDELVEAAAMLRAISEGTLDAVRIPEKALDVLAQQVVGEVAAQDWDERALFALFKRAAPYASLTWDEFEKVLSMLSEGVSTSRGRSRVHIHRDRVNGFLKARKGARLTALQNAGSIPDTFNYPVIAEPDEKQVGTLGEDFYVESMPGDVFLLGSTSWRIRRTYDGKIFVENAHGAPPSVPFWVGEAPARTEELSKEIGRLREDVIARPDARDWLMSLGLPPHAADLLVRYVKAGAQSLSTVPTQQTLIAERFFDDAGGMQLVIHSPFGARLNRAWGLALRKSFCRSFDFELQAAATDDGILLSLGEQHSFPLEDIFRFVSPNTAPNVLTQAVLQAPIFGTRFRWVASRALALARMSGGKRVPPPLQRARAEDLIAAVFPAQVGCQDNHGGADIEPPDHPLVNEALKDCLTDYLDLDGLVALSRAIKTGAIKTVAVDLPEPSVFAHQMLNSAPYTFLDDAPLEERRARAMSVRRGLPPEDAAAFGALDQDAITQVRSDTWPEPRDENELHDLMLQLGVLPLPLAEEQQGWLTELVRGGRSGIFEFGGKRLAFAAERTPWVQALYPSVPLPLAPLPGDLPVDRDEALARAVRGWMELIGPTTCASLAATLGLKESDIEQAMARLEQVGQVLRGRFTPGRSGEDAVEWCDRRLLQRIHRLTVGKLRRDIEPLSQQDFMRFLFRWHHLEPDLKLRGTTGLAKAVSLLQGWEAPAASWELDLIPARMHQYLPEWLERACWQGEVTWARLTLRELKPLPGPRRGVDTVPEAQRRPASPGRNALLTFAKREELEWMLLAARPESMRSDGPAELPKDLSHSAREVAEALERRGACFFQDLVSTTRRLPNEVEEGLWELLSRGLVTADAVQNLRVLQSPKLKRRQRATQRGGPGRWTLLRPHDRREPEELIEKTARLLLNRYGVVFRDLVAREPLAPPWRELMMLYRRMEARGEIRGGRFLQGFAGEQFALPEAVDMARAVRRAPKLGHVVTLAAVDPLNLTGVVTPGARVSAVMGQYVVYVDGVPREEELDAAR